MNDESIFSQPFDKDLLKALTSKDEKDWFKFRLGEESPSFGEVLGLPGARTGRWSRARQEREDAMKALLDMQLKAAHEQSMMPPTYAAAQAQFPTAYPMAGIAPSTSQIPQPPPVAGQAPGPAPLDYISPPAQHALMQQPMSPLQGHALMAAIPHAPVSAIQMLKIKEAEVAARSPIGKQVEDYAKLPPNSPFRPLILQDIMKSTAQEVGTPEYRQKLKELNVMPGHESPGQSLTARLSVEEDVRNRFTFEQAVKAGDELAQSIASKIGKENPKKYGKGPIFFSNLDAKDQDKALTDWARIRREAQPMDPGSAGRISMMTTALQELGSVRQMLFRPDGSIDRVLLTTAAFPFGGLWFTRGRTFNATIQDMIGAKYRIETGAAGNQGEIDNLAVRFTPSVRDSDETIRDKFNRFELFMKSALNLSDPGWVFRERAGMRPPNLDYEKKNEQELLDIMSGKKK